MFFYPRNLRAFLHIADFEGMSPEQASGIDNKFCTTCVCISTIDTLVETSSFVFPHSRRSVFWSQLKHSLNMFRHHIYITDFCTLNVFAEFVLFYWLITSSRHRSKCSQRTLNKFVLFYWLTTSLERVYNSNIFHQALCIDWEYGDFSKSMCLYIWWLLHG